MQPQPFQMTIDGVIDLAGNTVRVVNVGGPITNLAVAEAILEAAKRNVQNWHEAKAKEAPAIEIAPADFRPGGLPLRATEKC